MLTVILSSRKATAAALFVVFVVATFVGYVLWDMSGRIEKVHWSTVEINFRRR